MTEDVAAEIAEAEKLASSLASAERNLRQLRRGVQQIVRASRKTGMAPGPQIRAMALAMRAVTENVFGAR